MLSLEKITREELYEAVWTESVQKLAAKLGISDVGPAKIARKLKVPLPGRGYWAKRPVTRQHLRVPLPRAGRNDPTTYSTSQTTGGEQHQWKEESTQRIEKLGIVIPKVTPLKAGGPLNPDLEASRPLLVSSGLDSEDVRKKQVCADIAVTPGQIDRVLNMCQVLYEALERSGLVLEVVPPDPHARDVYGHESPRTSKTGVLILDTFVTFCIRESFNLVELPPPPPPPPPPPEPRRRRRWAPEPEADLPPPKEYRKEGTGALSLCIVSPHFWNTRRLWRDTKRHRLEDHLDEVLFTMCSIAEQEHASQIAAQKRALAEEVAREKRAVEAARQEKRKQRIYDLDSRLQDCHEADAIRDFLARLPPVKDPSPAYSEWVAWAVQLADELDNKAFSDLLELREAPEPAPSWSRPSWQAEVNTQLLREVDLWQRRYIYGRR